MGDHIALYSVSTAIGNFITEKYNIPVVYASALSTLVMYIMTKYNYENWHIIGIMMAVFIMYIYNKYKNHKDNNGKTFVVLNSVNDMNDIDDYMKEYKKYFGNQYNIKRGNIDAWDILNYRFMATRSILHHNQTIKFKDENFGISGYIKIVKYNKTTTNENKQQSSIAIDTPILYVYDNDKNINANDYVDMIIKRNRSDREKSSKIRLKYIKVFVSDKKKDIAEGNLYANHITQMYNGDKDNVKDRRKVYMKTFFHQEKKYILSLMDKIHNEPDFFTSLGQCPQLNLILYGPPGTGKSSFVHRLAMSYNRHIVSVDLSNVVDKGNVYQVIQRPCIDGFVYDDASKYIVLLEEFDIVVNTLKDKKRNETEMSATTIMNMFSSGKDEKKKVKEDSSNDNNNNNFYLEDLLEIIQGPVPRNGQIIIATTNKFEEIYEACPALFRPGRLTPIKFDYLNKTQVNKLIKYYMKRDDIVIDVEPKIPTSKIVEVIMYAKIINDPSYIKKNINYNLIV